jgi:hypothetical protein
VFDSPLSTGRHSAKRGSRHSPRVGTAPTLGHRPAEGKGGSGPILLWARKVLLAPVPRTKGNSEFCGTSLPVDLGLRKTLKSYGLPVLLRLVRGTSHQVWRALLFLGAWKALDLPSIFRSARKCKRTELILRNPIGPLLIAVSSGGGKILWRQCYVRGDPRWR